MYAILLLLHSYNRWLVVIAVVWALFLAWTGWLRNRPWNKWDDRAGWLFATAFSLQFVLGLLLYLQPDGMAQAALRDLNTAMGVRDLRFFGLEHPITMIVALTLAHLGRSRSRKATVNTAKYRWAAICFSISTVLVLLAIPWWRPILRTPTASALSPTSTVTTNQAITTAAVMEGSPSQGEVLFKQSIGGQPSCVTCHTLTEQRLVGPGLAGIGLRASQRVTGESAEQYLRDSILKPGAYVVLDYPDGVMPTSFAQVLTTQQVDDLVAYLLSLK